MDENPERVVVAGGGTGGHLFPGLSVAEELQRRRPSLSITFMGARGGLEQQLVPRAGYPLVTLSLAGIKGASLGRRVLAAAAAAWAVLRCIGWMLRRRPRLVIGVGGFASGPAVLAAKVTKVKSMVLEQNHYPGATNRWLAPRVDAVCLPSEDARLHIGGRTFVTGNPVREQFLEIGDPPGVQPCSVLIFGGSRGASSINHAVIEGLDELARREPPLRIVHQTGPGDETRVRDAYSRHEELAHEVLAFLDDMPARLAAADLVVSRAGASTIAELCAAGRPAILVPYPYAADDHQRRNAEALESAGAAEVLADADLDGSVLAARIAGLAADKGRRLAMGRAARSLARPDATRRIADIAEALIDGAPLTEEAAGVS